MTIRGAGHPDPSTRLFSASSISTVEAGQLLTGLTLTVGGVSDGNQEILTIGGQAVALTDGNSVGGTGKPTIAVSVNNGLASVTIHFAQRVSAADLASLVDGITYANQLGSFGEGTLTLSVTLTDQAGNRGPVATGMAAILQSTPGPITPEPESLIDGAKVTGSTDTRPDGSTTTKVVIEAPPPWPSGRSDHTQQHGRRHPGGA